MTQAPYDPEHENQSESEQTAEDIQPSPELEEDQHETESTQEEVQNHAESSLDVPEATSVPPDEADEEVRSDAQQEESEPDEGSNPDLDETAMSALEVPEAPIQQRSDAVSREEPAEAVLEAAADRDDESQQVSEQQLEQTEQQSEPAEQQSASVQVQPEQEEPIYGTYVAPRGPESAVLRELTAEELEAEMERRAVISRRLMAYERRAEITPDNAEVAEKARELAESAIEEPFRRGTWAGYTNHECKYCPDARLDEMQAWMHYAAMHMRERTLAEELAEGEEG